MSLKTKKRFKNLGKTIGIGLFTLLMLTNIKLVLLDDYEVSNSDVSLLGIEMNLFEGTSAHEGSGGCITGWVVCIDIHGQHSDQVKDR